MSAVIYPSDVTCEFVCRACLRVGVRFVKLPEQYVDETLEEFTGVQVPAGMGAPRRLCAWCARELQRGLAFRACCRRAADLLTMIAEENQCITLKHIQAVSTYIPSFSLSTTELQLIDIPPDTPEKDWQLKTETDTVENLSDADFDDYKVEVKDILKVEIDIDRDTIHYNDTEVKNELKSKSKAKKVKSTKKSVLAKDKKIDKCKEKTKRKSKKEVEKNKKEGSLILKSTKDYEEFEDKYNVKIARLSFEEQKKEVEDRRYSDAFVRAPYKCTQCNKGFHTEQSYKNHMIWHTEASGKFVCEVCGIHSSTRRQLMRHVSCHTRRFKCKQCEYVSFMPGKAIQHFQSHDVVQKHECKECKKQFSKLTSYLGHMRQYHADTECSICGSRVLGPKGLAFHMSKAHRAARCECGVVFLDVDKLNRHKEGGSCPGNHVKPCVQCGANFASDELLQQHGADKHNTFPCDQCGRSYPSPAALQKHQENIHGRARRDRRALGEEPFVCEVCGYSTHYKAVFISHQHKHTGETPFKCTYCPKGYRVKQQLITHMYSHTGELPHKCDLCPKAYRQPSNLGNHKKLVHSTERPYICEYCGKGFKMRFLRTSHQNTVHLKKNTAPRVRKRKP